MLGGRVDSGVAMLVRSVAADPDSPGLLNDLGAALLARVESSDWFAENSDAIPVRQRRDGDLPAALEAFNRSLEQSPDLQEALFNRALALERLHLRATARKAWQHYLTVDSLSSWAAEARVRLAAIDTAEIPDPVRLRAEIAAAAVGGDRERLTVLVQQQRHLARRTVEEELLPGWAEAALNGERTDATRRLAAARAIAEEWEAQTGDDARLEAIVEVETAGELLRQELVLGHRALGEGARAFAALNVSAAHAAANEALKNLPVSSKAAVWARALRLACVYYEAGDVESAATTILDDPTADVASRGRVLSIVGLWRAKRGDTTQALASYREALAAYERLEEREPTVWLRQMTGEAYGYMGASGLGWQYARAAMKDAYLLTEDWQTFTLFLASAMLALAEQHPRVAADFLDEALAVSVEHKPFEVVQAYLWRSRIQLALGDRDGANDDLIHAATWFRRLDLTQAQLLSSELNVVRGLLARDPADAVAALSKAIERFREMGALDRIPGVLLARAQAHLQAGRLDAADGDLRRAAVLNEQLQGDDHPQLLWAAPFDKVDQLFDERVRLALQRGREEEAFAVAEAGRSLSLRVGWNAPAEGTATTPIDALRLSDLRSRLEPGTTLLFFSVLADRVVQWRVERHRSSLITLPISPGELTRTAAALEADLEAGAWAETTREHAMRLYAALVHPAHLRDGPVVIVPDDDLLGLPFAALVDPASGRFLIEHRLISVAPSATAYVLARERSRSLGVAPPVAAFVVGDARVSPALFPDLHALPRARGEARAVAALYPRRQSASRSRRYPACVHRFFAQPPSRSFRRARHDQSNESTTLRAAACGRRICRRRRGIRYGYRRSRSFRHSRRRTVGPGHSEQGLNRRRGHRQPCARLHDCRCPDRGREPLAEFGGAIGSPDDVVSPRTQAG